MDQIKRYEYKFQIRRTQVLKVALIDNNLTHLRKVYKDVQCVRYVYILRYACMVVAANPPGTLRRVTWQRCLPSNVLALSRTCTVFVSSLRAAITPCGLRTCTCYFAQQLNSIYYALLSWRVFLAGLRFVCFVVSRALFLLYLF